VREKAIFAAVAIFLSGCVGGTAPEGDAGGAGPGTTAAGAGPWWSFTDTEGATRSRDTVAGKPVVLFFMATWCSTCKRLTGDLREVHAQYSERGVSVFSVTFDPTETDEDLEGWKARYSQPWPHGVDPSLSIQREFGVDAQSSVVVLDEKGNLENRWGYGQATRAAVASVLDDLLAETS
jgi:peroxiredoxin